MTQATCSRSRAFLMCILVLLCGMTVPAVAQGVTEPPPRIDAAELDFMQGVEAFEQEDYGMAYRRFRLVYETYPLNRKTTAAILMAGKALYREGAYQRAVDLMEALRTQYPTSSYTGEAQRMQGFAEQALRLAEQQSRTIQIGIALPMSDRQAAFTQMLFNGIRLAVEEHNEVGKGGLARMVFRDTQNEAAGASEAVSSLAKEDADVIIGPLLSRESVAAARQAERERIVLMPPMATNEEVGEGRTYVFQANPAITMRGRVMARFAIRDLRLTSFGVVAERGSNSISERMAEGFQDEALLLGANVEFFELLPGRRGWSSWADSMDAEVLSSVEAVYMPVEGRNAPDLIANALESLGRTGASPRVLGNTRWHDLSGGRRASRYNAVYTNEFYVDNTDPEVIDFQRRYRALAGESPSRLAYAGYDVGRYLLMHLSTSPDEPLQAVLREAPRYEGLGLRLDFQNSTINEALFFFHYDSGDMRLLR